mmetsp:Transcript_11680/g.50365  ORF Transcript_11680/g.50365 Transcript_11680/m.50365 type:complete len:235 (+) Transcript_11680:1363-2067(+)
MPRRPHRRHPAAARAHRGHRRLDRARAAPGGARVHRRGGQSSVRARCFDRRRGVTGPDARARVVLRENPEPGGGGGGGTEEGYTAGVVRLRDAPADHDAGVEGAAVDGERGVALQDGRERPAGAVHRERDSVRGAARDWRGGIHRAETGELAVVPTRSDRGARGAHDDLHAVRAEPGAPDELKGGDEAARAEAGGAAASDVRAGHPVCHRVAHRVHGRDGVGSVLFIYQSGVYQ